MMKGMTYAPDMLQLAFNPSPRSFLPRRIADMSLSCASSETTFQRPRPLLCTRERSASCYPLAVRRRLLQRHPIQRPHCRKHHLNKRHISPRYLHCSYRHHSPHHIRFSDMFQPWRARFHRSSEKKQRNTCPRLSKRR